MCPHFWKLLVKIQAKKNQIFGVFLQSHVKTLGIMAIEGFFLNQNKTHNQLLCVQKFGTYRLGCEATISKILEAFQSLGEPMSNVVMLHF